jgi:diadenosine tetraphosphate (Ap4A) HIT family hydrolase
MSSLDPQPRARSASDGGQTGIFRQSQPGVLSERLASFFKASLKHESFKTAQNVERNAGVCVPFLEAHVFPTIVKKGDEPHSLSPHRCHGVDEPRIDVDVRAVGGSAIPAD